MFRRLGQTLARFVGLAMTILGVWVFAAPSFSDLEKHCHDRNIGVFPRSKAVWTRLQPLQAP